MFFYLKNPAYLASIPFLLSVSCILLGIFLSENTCVQTFRFINKRFAFWVINQCFLLSLILDLMLTATLWASSPTPSNNEQPSHNLKNRWDKSLQTCKKLSCFPEKCFAEKYFPHMNVFPGASGKRGKRGNVHVSPERRSLILHPRITIYVIIKSVDFSGVAADLCQSHEHQRKAH